MQRGEGRSSSVPPAASDHVEPRLEDRIPGSDKERKLEERWREGMKVGGEQLLGDAAEAALYLYVSLHSGHVICCLTRINTVTSRSRLASFGGVSKLELEPKHLPFRDHRYIRRPMLRTTL